MAKDFCDLANQNPVPASSMPREKAMIHVIGFFNSRMGAMNRKNIGRIKELISTHEIAASELVDIYVKLVYENS